MAGIPESNTNSVADTLEFFMCVGQLKVMSLFQYFVISNGICMYTSIY